MTAPSHEFAHLPNWIVFLIPFARRLLHSPALRSLRPLSRQALAVSRPPGRIFARWHPDSGIEDPHPESLTILSANLWHDYPRFRELEARLEALALIVEQEGVDVLLLQEVARTPQIKTDTWLADRLGFASVYARANGHKNAIGFEEGLAVLSRHPLSRPQVRQLSPASNPFARRIGLAASIQTPFGSVNAVSAHLGFIPVQNAGQTSRLRRWVKQLSPHTPALIGGDFNAPEFMPHITRTQKEWIDLYRQKRPKKKALSFEMRLPGGASWRARFDYLFLQPAGKDWQVLDARYLDPPIPYFSDHRPVLAKIALIP